MTWVAGVLQGRGGRRDREIVRSGQAPHPDGTEADPRAWWEAYETAVRRAGGLGDVDAIVVGGQQHGMICLDERDEAVRPALLWNDTRSAGAAAGRYLPLVRTLNAARVLDAAARRHVLPSPEPML